MLDSWSFLKITWWDIFAILVSFAVAAWRFYVPTYPMTQWTPTDYHKDGAHFVVGWLVISGVEQRNPIRILLAVAVTTVEILCYVALG